MLMAAAPVKSPLHNFPLTFLKWGSKKDTRCRRTPPFDTPLSSPCSDDSPVAVEQPPPYCKPVGSRSSRNRRYNNHHQLSTGTASLDDDDDDDDGEEERETGRKEKSEVVAEVGGGGGDEKGWNLRPRRAVTMKGTCSYTNNIMMVETTVGGVGGDGLPKSMRLRGMEAVGSGGVGGGNGGGERREKRKFWIALSRDEIEEDIYSMTGSKPSRRPKKRLKIVQKQLDNVFPGLWLVGISPEAYRGLDVPPKR